MQFKKCTGYVISLINIWRSKIWCAMQCNAKSPYPKCYSSVHNVRSFLQCNAIQCNATCYLFTEHGKELVSVCYAIQCKTCIANVSLQCTTLELFVQCNAKCYLFNEHLKELVLMCNAMQKVHGLWYSSMHNVRSIVQCNAKCYLFNKHLKELVLVCKAKSA